MKQHLIKNSQIFLTTALGLVTLAMFNSTSLAQGSLTPPAGAPAPVMKSLDQIEARTAIATAPITITKPGSYYLTTNLTVAAGNAITIAASGVSLDLNGFTIASTAATPGGYGICVNAGLKNISIENGFIQGGVTNNGSGVYSGTGFNSGILALYPNPTCIRASRVAVTGCLAYGINLDTSKASSVQNCTVATVGNWGIMADTVTDSVVSDCGGNSAIIAKTVLNSSGTCATSGTGIQADCVNNCYGNSNSGIGINAATVCNSFGNGNLGTGIEAKNASNCYGNANTSGYGIHASGTATDCYAYSATGIALLATAANNCVAKRPGGRAIQATMANGCYAISGTNLITYKYNMP